MRVSHIHPNAIDTQFLLRLDSFRLRGICSCCGLRRASYPRPTQAIPLHHPGFILHFGIQAVASVRPFWFFNLYVVGGMAEERESVFVVVLDEPVAVHKIPDLHVFMIKPTVGAGGRFIFVLLIVCYKVIKFFLLIMFRSRRRVGG